MNQVGVEPCLGIINFDSAKKLSCSLNLLRDCFRLLGVLLRILVCNFSLVLEHFFLPFNLSDLL
jgi:hypothetical protein